MFKTLRSFIIFTSFLGFYCFDIIAQQSLFNTIHQRFSLYSGYIRGTATPTEQKQIKKVWVKDGALIGTLLIGTGIVTTAGIVAIKKSFCCKPSIENPPFERKESTTSTDSNNTQGSKTEVSDNESKAESDDEQSLPPIDEAIDAALDQLQEKVLCIQKKGDYPQELQKIKHKITLIKLIKENRKNNICDSDDIIIWACLKDYANEVIEILESIGIEIEQ